MKMENLAEREEKLWKLVYPEFSLPVKIINTQLNENYHRDQDLLHLS